MTPGPREFRFTAPTEAAGERLDRFLADCLEPEGISRARIQALIQEQSVQVQARPSKPSTRLKPGDQVRVVVPPIRPLDLKPENLPLDILFEDSAVVVVNKPSGMAVHPARGSEEGTLVHVLLYRITDLSGVGGRERPGIVHRLDKDTSGILVVAKHDQAHHALCEQFKEHSTSRKYLALVRGAPTPIRGSWSSNLGRNPHNRLKMKSLRRGGKPALTHFHVLESFPGASLLGLCLETGRTHQIRVHCSEAGCPVLGDEVYGRRWTRGIPEDPGLLEALDASGRQLLHARTLGFVHPTTGERLEFCVEPPVDFLRVLECFRRLAVSSQYPTERCAGER